MNLSSLDEPPALRDPYERAVSHMLKHNLEFERTGSRVALALRQYWARQAERWQEWKARQGR